MRTLGKALLLLAIATSALCAQETRHTIINPSPNPADDAKLNSPKVPDVYAITAHFDHLVILRFKYKTDLLAGLKEMVQQQHIRNGVILAAVGSVRSYHLHQTSNRSFPSQDTFEENPSASADLVSMNGYIVDGKVHAHVTLALPDRAIAGHLEPGTQVFTFAIVTIGVIKDADLNRVDDKTYR